MHILPEQATLRLRTLADSLHHANADGDAAGAYDLTRSIGALNDSLARGLTVEVFGLNRSHIRTGCPDITDLRAQLFTVRQQRQHLLGSPRDYARLSAEETRLTRELERGAA